MAARTLNRLVSKQVESLGPGRHADGGGLYLDKDEHGQVPVAVRHGSRTASAGRWAWAPPVRMAWHWPRPRVAAGKARDALERGDDPILDRDAMPDAPVVRPTFGEVADKFVSSLSPQWRNEKHRAQSGMTLANMRPTPPPVPVDECLRRAGGAARPVAGQAGNRFAASRAD